MQLGLFDRRPDARPALDGLHYRIPDPTDPARCRCGESLNADTATHDRAHDAWVRNLGALLAPAVCR